MKVNNLDEISEIDIIEEAPKKVLIGKRWVLIRQLTFREYFWLVRRIVKIYFKYTSELSEIIKLIQEEDKEKSKTKKIFTRFIILIKIKTFRKDLFKILNNVYPTVGRRFLWSQSYLEKHATMNDIIQLVFGLYQYNFADLKKNILQLLQSMDLKETEVSQILTSSSKKSSGGQPEAPMTPRFKRPNSTQENTAKSTPQPKPDQEKQDPQKIL